MQHQLQLLDIFFNQTYTMPTYTQINNQTLCELYGGVNV